MTITTPGASAPTDPATYAAVRSTTYGHQLRVVLAVAFTLSAAHTVYSRVAGIGDPRFTVDTPVAWLFYGVGFAAAAASVSARRWAHWLLLGYLVVLLYVAIFYYPTTFEPRQQTWFGWFENDVYTGLLLVSAHLALQRLRRVTLVP